jgi:hypothetical protein
VNGCTFLHQQLIYLRKADKPSVTGNLSCHCNSYLILNVLDHAAARYCDAAGDGFASGMVTAQ